MADYESQLAAKLSAARKRLAQGNEMKALKNSAPTLFEIIDGQITLELNKMTAEEPLDYDKYLSVHGRIKGMQSIRSLINSKEAEAPAAQQEADAIENNIQNIRNEKQK